MVESLCGNGFEGVEAVGEGRNFPTVWPLSHTPPPPPLCDRADGTSRGAHNRFAAGGGKKGKGVGKCRLYACFVPACVGSGTVSRFDISDGQISGTLFLKHLLVILVMSVKITTTIFFTLLVMIIKVIFINFIGLDLTYLYENYLRIHLLTYRKSSRKTNRKV